MEVQLKGRDQEQISSVLNSVFNMSLTLTASQIMNSVEETAFGQSDEKNKTNQYL